MTPDLPQREPDERLADWVDDRMNARERDRFEAELRVNPRLRAEAEDYRRTVAGIQQALRAPLAKVDLVDRVVTAIASKQATFKAGRRLRLLPSLVSVAAAAALLLTAVLLQQWQPGKTSTETAAADALRAGNPSSDGESPSATGLGANKDNKDGDGASGYKKAAAGAGGDAGRQRDRGDPAAAKAPASADGVADTASLQLLEGHQVQERRETARSIEALVAELQQAELQQEELRRQTAAAAKQQAAPAVPTPELAKERLTTGKAENQLGVAPREQRPDEQDRKPDQAAAPEGAAAKDQVGKAKDQAGKVGAPDPAAKAKAAPAAPRGARPGEPDALGRLHNPGAAKADDSSRVAIQPAVPAVVLARRAQIPAAGGPPSPAQQPPSSPTVFFGLLAQQQDAAGVAGKGVAVPTIRQWSLPVAAPDTNLFLQHEVHFGNRTEVAGQEAQATGLLALREDVRRLLGDDGQGTSVFLVEGDRTQVTALLQQVRAFAAPEQWDLRVDEVAATAVAELEQLPLPQGQVLLQQQTRPLATVLQDQVQQPPSAANDRRKSEVPVAGAAADDKADDKAKVPPPAAQQQPAERVRVMLLYRDVAVPLPAEQKAREPRKD